MTALKHLFEKDTNLKLNFHQKGAPAFTQKYVNCLFDKVTCQNLCTFWINGVNWWNLYIFLKFKIRRLKTKCNIQGNWYKFPPESLPKYKSRIKNLCLWAIWELIRYWFFRREREIHSVFTGEYFNEKNSVKKTTWAFYQRKS